VVDKVPVSGYIPSMKKKKNQKIRNVLKKVDPVKNRWFSEEDSVKFSKYFEFQKCTDPTLYVKSLGYKIVLGDANSKKPKNKKVLIFSIEPRGKRFKIFIKGATIGGEFLVVTIKPFHVFNQSHLNAAIHKWSIFAHRIDSKIFDVFSLKD
jgi:hypothetical protein